MGAVCSRARRDGRVVSSRVGAVAAHRIRGADHGGVARDGDGSRGGGNQGVGRSTRIVMGYRLALTVLACAQLVGTAAAQSQGPARADATAASPDLSGTWILNKAKSDFGMMPTPAADTAIYTRAGTMYRVIETSGSDTGAAHVEYTWPAGSGESSTDLPDLELNITTHVTQRGDTAKFVSQLRHKGQPVEIESGREYLSPDGKVRTREFDLQSLANPDEDTQHVIAVFDRR